MKRLYFTDNVPRWRGDKGEAGRMPGGGYIIFM